MMTTTEPTIEILDPEVVGAELAKVRTEAGVTEDAALALQGEFASYYNTIVQWREQAATITNPEDPAQREVSRSVRLGLKNVRCEVERVRKALKADSLARGKAIDGFANVLKYLCEPVENKLLEIEQHVERKEAARIAAVADERARMIVAEGGDPTAYNLGVMAEDVFAAVLAGAKQTRVQREEAAAKAEEERVAREQADRIARAKAEAEAARLREEARVRDAQIAAEREAAAKKQREADAAAAKERAIADAKLRAEREAREKAEREAAAARKAEQDRIAAEKKAEAERIAAENAAKARAARAPDKEKIVAFASAVRSLTGDVPEMATDAGLDVTAAIVQQIEKFAAWVESMAAKL